MQKSAPPISPPPPKHRTYEDIQALLTGTMFVSLGIVMFGHTGLLTGGTAGVAFLLHYATGWNFGLLFFAVNVPFYGLAWKRMGKAFTVKTIIAVGLLALLTNVLPKLVHFDALNPAFSAIMGGLLMGGGFNVLVLYLQDRFGWRAGRIQMALDCSIVLCSFAVVEWQYTALSILGAVVLNQTLATNHRVGRYMAL